MVQNISDRYTVFYILCILRGTVFYVGVENMLMHYIPEVKGIIEVSQEDDSTDSKLKFTPDAV